MATKRWTGNALAVKQVTTIAVTGTWATNDTATITINGKDLTVTVGAAVTVAGVVAAIVAAINATSATDGVIGTESRNVGGQEIPELTEVVASGSTSPITLTAVDAGKPFTVTTSETTAGDGELGDPSNTTAATGPNHWDNADNWSTGSLPADTDDVVIDTGDISILYGLDQGAITLTSLTVTAGFTGTIGLPELNVDSTTNTYREYRSRYLTLGNAADANPTAITIGEGDGNGSGRIKLDSADSQVTLNVLGTGTRLESAVPSLLWKGTHASNVVNVTRGQVGVAQYAGETATVATLRVGFVNNQAGDSIVYCGSGTTLTTVNQTGGILTTNSNVTTVNQTGGELIHQAGTLGTLNCDAGEVRYLSTGTLTTANVGSGGTLDFRRDMRGRTVTNCNLYEGSSYFDPNGTVTHTNGIDLIRCTPADLVAFAIPPHRTITLSSV